jgi:hypothetical protein
MDGSGGGADDWWNVVAAGGEDVRWNSWVRVQPVQFEGDERAVPRAVRLSCSAARVGDAVRVRDERRWIGGWIAAVRHSVLHVRMQPIHAEGSAAAESP